MTRGIAYLYVETHSFGKAVAFWQRLGFVVDLDLGGSGRLIHPDGGAALFVEEVPETKSPEIQIYLDASTDAVRPERPAEIAQDWHDSHWGTRLLELRDPDARTVVVQSGGYKAS